MDFKIINLIIHGVNNMATYINRLSKKILTVFIILFFNVTFFGQNQSAQIKNLTKSSDLIMIGKVSETVPFWNTNKTRIITKVVIQPDEFIKGKDVSNEITFNVLGGEIGDIGEIYSHMPIFEKDEEVLVFAQRDNKSQLRITGGELGKLRLLRDDETGERITTSKRKISDLKNEIKLSIIE